MVLDEIRFVDWGKLGDTLALHESYISAEPFPSIAIDNFLPAEHYALLRDSFPDVESDIWYKFRSGRENKKLQSQTFDGLPWPLKLFFNEANGPTFTRFLESLTGISGLVPDPHLYGGGLHQTLPGGHLGVHVDYNYHKDWKLDRRLNAILYLNDDWQDEWGGHLELWDRDVASCVSRIAPVGNRLVVFSTSEHSWHGHPSPLACPPGRTRKSLALYYYSNGRPEEEQAPGHNTIFKERPSEKFQLTTRERLRGILPESIQKAARNLVRCVR